ncbi:hypothetical protein BPJM79_20399 [Bacillus pumilus]
MHDIERVTFDERKYAKAYDHWSEHKTFRAPEKSMGKSGGLVAFILCTSFNSDCHLFVRAGE